MARRGANRLSPPKVVTFGIAVLLAFIGVVAKMAPIASLVQYAFWFVVAGFILLALANLLDGL